MATNLEISPDYEAVLQALLEKTKEGKIQWQETADTSIFVAAAKGEQTFEITWISEQTIMELFGESVPSCSVLSVKDRDGKLLFMTPNQSSKAATELYDLARRIATRVDERIESTLEFINQL